MLSSPTFVSAMAFIMLSELLRMKMSATQNFPSTQSGKVKFSCRDLDIINTELILKDLEFCGNRLNEVESVIRRNNSKESKEEKEVLDKVKALLEAKRWVRTGDWNFKEVEILNKFLFITAKNVVYLINLSAQDFVSKKNKWLKGIKDWIDGNCPGDIIPYSADLEKELFEEYD